MHNYDYNRIKNNKTFKICRSKKIDKKMLSINFFIAYQKLHNIGDCNENEYY